MGNAIDVNSAGGYVGGNKYPVAAVTEPGERLVALILCAIAMHGNGFGTGSRKPLRQTICSMLRAGKDQERPGLFVQHVLKQPDLQIVLNFIEVEIDFIGRSIGAAADRNTNRVVRVASD